MLYPFCLGILRFTERHGSTNLEPYVPSALPTRRFRLSALVLSIVVLATGVLVGGAPAQAAATYSVSGTVYLGSTATPAGAGEVLVRLGTGGSYPASGVLTDATGSFTIPGLVDGHWYYLLYDYQGTEAYPDIYHPGVVEDEDATPLKIAGADIPGLSAVVPAPGTITGTVTQLATGEPYSDVDVTLWHYEQGTAALITGPTVSPDSDGVYSIPNIPAGNYTLRFENTGSAPVQSAFYGAAGVIANATFTRFGGATDTAPRNIAMTPVQTITGTVSLGTSGNPAGAGKVSVTARYRDEGAYVVLPVALTASDGRYTLPNLGTRVYYDLTFTFLGTDLQGYFTSFVTNVGSSTGAITTKNVTLARANTIAGAVQLGEGGSMAGPGDVTISFSRYSYAPRMTTTRTGGGFVANTLDAGSYTVTFHYSGSGYPDFIWPVPIVVPADVTNLAVVMPRGGTIAGQVFMGGTNRNGILPYADVVAHRVDPDSGAELSRYTTVADWKGRYSFAPVADGRYWVEFTDNGNSLRSWGGGDKFDTPDYFDVVNADTHLGIDVEIYWAGEINVYIAAPLIDDPTDGAFTTELQIRDGSDWIDSNYPAYGSWNKSIYDLPPRDYRIRVAYDGVLGHSETLSPVITLAPGENRRYDAYLVSPEPPLAIGSLIKHESSPSVYLVDGPANLIRVENTAILSDAGIPTTVQTVRSLRFQGRTVSDDPLSSVIRCGAGPGKLYLATEGHLVRLSDELAATWDATTLTEETCAALPISTGATIQDALYVSLGYSQVYRVGPNQQYQPVLNLLDNGALVVNRYPVYTVNQQFFFDHIGLTQAGVPGALFTTSTSPSIYFSDADALLRASSLSTVADFGLPTTATVIPPSYLDVWTVRPQSLGNLIECDGSYYIGSGGMKQPVAAALVAGLDSISLNPDTCNAFPTFRPAPNYFVPPVVSTALFLKSPSSTTVYYVNADGEKQAVTSTAEMNRLSAPVAARVLTVNATYLASIPTGTQLVAPGSLVKSSTSSTIYMATDLSSLVPVRTAALAADFGLPTAYTTVTPQTIADMTVANEQLSNAVTCGSTTYIASAGRLWPIAPSAVGSGLGSVTALPPVLCASLLKSSTFATPLYLRSPSGRNVYLVDAGTKRTTLVSRQSSAPVLTVNAAYLDTLTTVCSARSWSCSRISASAGAAAPTPTTPRAPVTNALSAGPSAAARPRVGRANQAV